MREPGLNCAASACVGRAALQANNRRRRRLRFSCPSRRTVVLRVITRPEGRLAGCAARDFEIAPQVKKVRRYE
jgi:hypothetical protein